MEWKVFLGAFALIFLAELGDKTQLAALCLVKSPAHRWLVFAGASAALVASTLIAVLAGGWLAAHVPPKYFKLAAGALFLVFGALTLLDAFRSGGDSVSCANDAPVSATVEAAEAAIPDPNVTTDE